MFLQYPGHLFGGRTYRFFLNARMKARKGLKVVTLVYDIDAARFDCPNAADGVEENLCEILNLSDAVIVHNDKMAAWLAQRGFDRSRMVSLDVFDCLVKDGEVVERPGATAAELPRIAIAGNLSPEKSEYVSHLDEIPGVRWALYGVGADKLRKMERVEYMGCFDPSELPNKIDADFGLVWDGPATETCASRMGEYLRINNPHKLSLYLAAGLPVIIWSQAAEADFVLKEGVGIVVDSLSQIPGRIAQMAADSRECMQKNVLRISKKITSGAYLKGAIESAIEIVASRHSQNGGLKWQNVQFA